MVRRDKLEGSLERIFESTIDSRGRTTIPKAVREVLDLRAGGRVGFVVEDGEARLWPLRSVARLRGIVQYTGRALSLKEMDRAIAKGALDRIGRGRT